MQNLGQIFVLDFPLLSVTSDLQSVRKILPFLKKTISIVKLSCSTIV